MNAKIITAVAALLLASSPSYAQLSQARIEARTSFTNDGSFSGDRLSIALAGSISDEFSYCLFHHLNKGITAKNLFQATDQAYVRYTPGEHFSIQAGKSVVEYGGFEYDSAPIDVYYAGEYWNHFYCFQIGVTAAYRFNEGKDRIAFQICRSPYDPVGEKALSYNLFWGGRHGILDTWQSVNCFECPSDGGRIAHIALGYKFNLNPVTIRIDAINRCDVSGMSLGRDYSIVCDASVAVGPSVNIVAKGDYDRNGTVANDMQSPLGTDMLKCGCALEFFPVRGSRDVRLHLVAYRSKGTIGTENADGTHLSMGVKWNFNLLKKISE